MIVLVCVFVLDTRLGYVKNISFWTGEKAKTKLFGENSPRVATADVSTGKIIARWVISSNAMAKRKGSCQKAVKLFVDNVIVKGFVSTSLKQSDVTFTTNMSFTT